MLLSLRQYMRPRSKTSAAPSVVCADSTGQPRRSCNSDHMPAKGPVTPPQGGGGGCVRVGIAVGTGRGVEVGRQVGVGHGVSVAGGAWPGDSVADDEAA